MTILLDVRGVTKRYGGLVANSKISFQVGHGELVGIIGPNGAGKSTLFDLVTGFQSADEGQVLLEGEPVTRLRPDEISRRGVGRTFQKLRPFAQMTAVENVMVGAFQKTTDPARARSLAMEALDRVGLADKAEAHARVLSTGQRKRLELARALATQPRLLLLDEVTGGVDQRSIPALVELVRRLHGEGASLIVIEHNMGVIMGISQRIVALNLGEVIADGPPAVVGRDPPMLEAQGLNVLYGDYQILWDVSFRAPEGEVIAILGPNGSGKSTLMNTLSGLLRSRTGAISFRGARIDGLPPHKIVGQGLAHVLERRRLFPYLTVRENLLLGAYHPSAKARRQETLADVEALFPRLRERRAQLAGTLSGGEQQMVAIGRGLMARPDLLMIDEPFLGLAPKVIEQIAEVISAINRERGITIVFIEQNVELALRMAHRGYILESGRAILEGPSADLLASTEVKRIFLGH